MVAGVGIRFLLRYLEACFVRLELVRAVSRHDLNHQLVFFAGLSVSRFSEMLTILLVLGCHSCGKYQDCSVQGVVEL